MTNDTRGMPGAVCLGGRGANVASFPLGGLCAGRVRRCRAEAAVRALKHGHHRCEATWSKSLSTVWPGLNVASQRISDLGENAEARRTSLLPTN